MPELITNGLKNIRKKTKHLVVLDSVTSHPCAMGNPTEAFGLLATKSCYPTILIQKKTSIM